MNRYFNERYSNSAAFNRNSATTETKFFATARRSLCVSTRSADDEDASPVVWTSEFSTTISVADAAGSNANETEAINATAESRSANFCKPFVPLGLSGMTLPQIERAAILETLLACEGNRCKTARKLGVSEKTIYNKIKVYKLKAELDVAFGNVEQAS